MNTKFSCSTMWNIRSYENKILALEEMVDMGFEQVELNYLVTSEDLKQITPFINSGNIEVSSIHNVFPKVSSSDYDTDSPLLGYLDDDKRKTSIELTKKSIDYASELGALAVVLHVSTIPMSTDYNNILKNLYKEGLRNSQEYEIILNNFLEERKTLSKKVLDLTSSSMLELSDYIEKKQYKVKLGIENRAQINQIPTLEETSLLLDSLKDTPSYFWYDIGHGILMENMGVFEVFPYINKLKDKIIGMHIHDALGTDDHYYPYKFGDGFDKYLEFIKSSPIKVFEVGPKCNRFEVENSLKKIKNYI